MITHCRLPAILTLTGLACCAQSVPPKQAEQALRLRVKQFYTLMVSKKFREAERFVAPESRDTYYDQEKPAMKDFTITGIQWVNKFQKADVSLTSEVAVRRAVIGQFNVRVPFASHWTLEHGQWMWYVPKVYSRSTPFGPMKVDEDAAKQSGLDIDAMIAKGPKPEQLLTGVKVDATKVKIPDELGKTASVTLENSLPGVVHLSAQVVTTAGVVAELSKRDLGLGDKAELKIRRIGTSQKGSMVYVRVEPTGQSLAIALE